MERVRFQAFGHENVLGKHRITIEITAEDYLTLEGTCIIGIRTDQTLSEMTPKIKTLASSEKTKIILRLKAGNHSEEVTGRGDPGLTYSNSVSMVARRSTFVCDRTLMVEADKAASDLDRSFVESLRDPNVSLECELLYVTE